MKTRSAQFSVLSLVIFIASFSHAQQAKKDKAPVTFPKLDHFAPLWEHSIFTTKDLPSPDAPTGPNFADNLSLSGIYEIDGGVVAVLVDRTTSQVMEARIGSENEMGIKIRKVTPGATVDKTRIQLQKGDQAGWISFADPSANQPAEVVQRAGIPTQTTIADPQAMNQADTLRRSVRSFTPPVTVSSGIPQNHILPPPSTPIPSAPAAPNDVPLPPP